MFKCFNSCVLTTDPPSRQCSDRRRFCYHKRHRCDTDRDSCSPIPNDRDHSLQISITLGFYTKCTWEGESSPHTLRAVLASVAFLAATNIGHEASATPTTSTANGLAAGMVIGEIALVAKAAEANNARLVQFLNGRK